MRNKNKKNRIKIHFKPEEAKISNWIKKHKISFIIGFIVFVAEFLILLTRFPFSYLTIHVSYMMGFCVAFICYQCENYIIYRKKRDNNKLK